MSIKTCNTVITIPQTGLGYPTPWALMNSGQASGLINQCMRLLSTTEENLQLVPCSKSWAVRNDKAGYGSLTFTLFTIWQVSVLTQNPKLWNLLFSRGKKQRSNSSRDMICFLYWMFREPSNSEVEAEILY